MSYSPTIGRWMQRDPAGYVDGASLYQYERSDAASGVDPTGLQYVPDNSVETRTTHDPGTGRMQTLYVVDPSQPPELQRLLNEINMGIRSGMQAGPTREQLAELREFTGPPKPKPENGQMTTMSAGAATQPTTNPSTRPAIRPGIPQCGAWVESPDGWLPHQRAVVRTADGKEYGYSMGPDGGRWEGLWDILIWAGDAHIYVDDLSKGTPSNFVPLTPDQADLIHQWLDGQVGNLDKYGAFNTCRDFSNDTVANIKKWADQENTKNWSSADSSGGDF